MDDFEFGNRNKRGDWAASARLEVAPLFAFPLNAITLLKWLPHYFLPWKLLFAASAVAYWRFFVPSLGTLRTLSFEWALWLFAVNCAAVLVFYGAFELRLYRPRAQGARFKYNARFPADQPSRALWFKSQTLEGMLQTFITAAPIWTGYEVALLWAFANGVGPWVSFADHPLYLLAVGLMTPIYRDTRFFIIHPLIHGSPLYRWVHSVHHNPVDPSPWSSLSMHPVEHLLYFSSALRHMLIPSNPILALYQLNDAGFGAMVRHIGFDKIEIGENAAFESQAYGHYLHHRYFEVNYGDGLVPFDKLFGAWYDGTAEADAQMKGRLERRRARANCNRAAV